ncbi:MAG TPA: class I SAM-dependent methyltransferase [Actinomycetes bacterium]
MATADGPSSVNFDRAAGYYDATRGLPPEVGDRVAARIEAAARPGARFLEVGVGTGRIALPLQQRGCWVVGVDLSAAMMAAYRDKAAAAGLPAPRLLRGDATRLPLADASVDVVIEVHVLHLVPDWRRALGEVRRVLAPGGSMLLGWGPGLPYRAGSPRDILQRRMRELTADATPEWWVGLGDARQKLAALADLGGVEEQLGGETWSTEETWAVALDEADRRVFSYAWRVPEDAWHAAAARVRAEVTAEHPDLDAPVPVQRSFQLTRVRFG